MTSRSKGGQFPESLKYTKQRQQKFWWGWPWRGFPVPLFGWDQCSISLLVGIAGSSAGNTRSGKFTYVEVLNVNPLSISGFESSNYVGKTTPCFAGHV